MKKIILTIAVVLSVQSCATIIEGKTQKIKINDSGNGVSRCELTNGVGSYTTNSELEATVNKSKTDMKVDCGSGEALVESKFAPWTLANIVIGGLVGFAIDGISGAMFKYPESIGASPSIVTSSK